MAPPTLPDADAVLAGLAEDSGIARERLVPAARLREDLGLSGEAGWSLFAIVERRFATDVGAAARDFARYFPVERRLRWHDYRVLLPSAFAGGVLPRLLGWPGWTAWLAGAAIDLAAVAAVRLRQRRAPRAGLPVTVAMLLAAVEEGTWSDPRIADDQASIGR